MLRHLLRSGSTSAGALAGDSDFDGAREWLAWLAANTAGAGGNAPAPFVTALPGCLTASRSQPGGVAALSASLLAP